MGCSRVRTELGCSGMFWDGMEGGWSNERVRDVGQAREGVVEGTRAEECLEQRARRGWNCVRGGEGSPGSCGTTVKGWLLCSGVPELDPQSECPRVGLCQGRSQRAPSWFVGCWTLSPGGANLLLVGTSFGMLSAVPGPNHLRAPPPSSPRSPVLWEHLPGTLGTAHPQGTAVLPGQPRRHCTTQLCSWEKPRWSLEIAPKEALPAVPWSFSAPESTAWLGIEQG